jgi:hypothetical protein
MKTEALEKGVALLSEPGITFGNAFGYEYKNWQPLWIPFMQASSGIWEADDNGLLPYAVVVPPGPARTFQIILPKDHPFLLLDVKVGATKWNSVDTGVEYSRFISPFPDLAPQSPRIGTSNAATDAIELSAHGYSADDRVTFQATAGGSLPGGLTPGVSYFVLAAGLTADTFRVSLTSGGAAINLTTSIPVYVLGTPLAGTVPSTNYLWTKYLFPQNEDISASLIAVSPAGRPVFGGFVNATGFTNKILNVGPTPHIERVPLHTGQTAHSGRGSLRNYYLFPENGIVRVEVENSALGNQEYKVNGMIFGYVLMR